MSGILQLGTPDFCRTKVLPGIFNRSNFEYVAFRSYRGEKKEEKKVKKRCPDKKNSFQVGVNEHNQKERWLIMCSKKNKPFFINIGNYRDISVQIRQLFTYFWSVKFFGHVTRRPHTRFA